MADKIELPITCMVKGVKWHLFTFEYTSPDGDFCGYLHAVSAEHAAAMLADMKDTAELKGRMIEAGL